MKFLMRLSKFRIKYKTFHHRKTISKIEIVHTEGLPTISQLQNEQNNQKKLIDQMYKQYSKEEERRQVLAVGSWETINLLVKLFSAVATLMLLLLNITDAAIFPASITFFFVVSDTIFSDYWNYKNIKSLYHNQWIFTIIELSLAAFTYIFSPKSKPINAFSITMIILGLVILVNYFRILHIHHKLKL